ncbi:MAG: hypothetical protein ABIT37_06105 [Luteolibacter sp.]
MINRPIFSHLILAIMVMGLFGSVLSAAPAPIRIGVLQATPEQAGTLGSAGVTLTVLSVSWDRFEPAAGTPDPTYIRRLRAGCDAFHRAGIKIVLDPGFQYPPAWLLELPDSRYQNQHGDTFIDPSPGKNIPNPVFNAAIRERQADYLRTLFRELGTDFHAVRLGGGWFNEINYPSATFHDHANCYWAFDALAQGARPGLPVGMTACPVPGWKPGDASPDHTSARRFLDWYLASLQNYHDWQITTVRRLYAGPLMMMYPSWGIRPGQIDSAIAGDLAGHTPPEKNGEIQRGFDFARFIGGIRDPKVGVHCTWLDSNPSWSDETSSDSSRWSPVHYLSSLARQHAPPLVVSAENTGGGGPEILRLCAERALAYEVKSVFWAFAPDLLDGRPPELKDLTPAFSKP